MKKKRKRQNPFGSEALDAAVTAYFVDRKVQRKDKLKQAKTLKTKGDKL